MTLIENWKSHCIDIGLCALDIFATADVKITEQGFADPTFLALTLLSRTLSNLKGVTILLDARRIIEARTITRCCLENLYWTVGLAEDGSEFVKRMRDDELSHKKALGQALFSPDYDLDQPIEERLRELMRNLNKTVTANKMLNPKSVASIREDFKKTYIFYAQLSSDSAHPSVTALNRYVVSGKKGEAPGFDTDPVIKSTEIEETYEYLSMACLGVCVAVNQIIGGTRGGEKLNAIAERHTELSVASRGSTETKTPVA